MEPTPPKTDEALSKGLLLIGLLLVVGAIAVYHFSPRFKPPEKGTPQASSQLAEPPEAAAPSIRGEAAPAFELPTLDGKKIHLADFKGKVLLVNFWATWCGPCLLELPWFLEFKKKYGPEGLEILAVNIYDEGPQVVAPFVEKHGMQPLTVAIGESATAELFGGFPGLPTTFIVDRDGKYYSKHLGLVQKDDVEEEIQTLLRGSAAQPTTTSGQQTHPTSSPSAAKG